MKRLFLMGALLATVSVRATIISFNELAMGFTNPATVITNATWSGGLAISTNGLGWEGATNASKEFWIQSSPVAIGTSWRPASAVTVIIEPDSDLPENSSCFVRYSPDNKHWSGWQAVDQHRGVIEVPRIESEEYHALLMQYQKMDVPLTSDEEAAVKWILQRQPDFFEKHLPFVGYVQFRTEGWMRGGQSIRVIKIRLLWAVSGLSAIAKDPTAHSRPGNWSFEAK